MFALKGKRQKTALFVSIGLVTLVIYFQFLLKPKISAFNVVFREARRVSKEVSQTKEDIANISKFEEQLRDLKQKVSSYEKNIPKEQEISVLLKELSEFAQATDVKILVIQPLEETKKEGKEVVTVDTKMPYLEVPISIEGKATYHNLGFFINELENAEHFMRITDIKIQVDSSMPRWHNVKLTIGAYCLAGEGKE